MRSTFLVLAAAVATVSATPALAHPKLLSANPAPNTVVAAPARVQLSFSETLVAQFSGGDLSMTEMPGMKMASPMRMAITASLAPDGKTLVLAPARPLSRGTYKLDWHAVSTDTHRVQGSYVFKVR